MQRIIDKIRYDILRQVPRDRPFIFGIGLSKTGTTSLNDALNILDYQAYHLPPICKVEGGQIKQDWPWWVYKYNAMTDLSVALLHRELDAQFPNARFIYTPRPIDSWLDSCRRHFTKELAEMRVAQKQTYLNDICAAFYGSELYQADSYRAAYEAFEAEIYARYTGRADFLNYDVIGGDGWEPLCAFLGKPVPDAAFPFSNKGRAA